MIYVNSVLAAKINILTSSKNALSISNNYQSPSELHSLAAEQYHFFCIVHFPLDRATNESQYSHCCINTNALKHSGVFNTQGVKFAAFAVHILER